MGTTSSELARNVLVVMAEEGVRFGILHDPAYLDGDQLSDVDTVVAEPPGKVIDRCLARWRDLDLHQVTLWKYDIGGTLTVFLMTSNARSGVQLDLLFDPRGVGKYGVRSNRLLEHVRPGIFPFVSEPSRLVYLYQKRRVKGQASSADEVVDRARRLPDEELESVARDLTGRTDLVEAVRGGRPGPPRRRGLRLRAVRLMRRAARPIGHWAHVSDPAVATELASRFKSVLPVVMTDELPRPYRQIFWYLRKVAPVRYRPGLFISWGARIPLQQRICHVVESAGTEDAARSIIREMERRTLCCVS